MNQNIHKNRFMDLTPWVQSVFRSLLSFLGGFLGGFFFGTFSLYTPMGSGIARRDPTHVTPKVNLYMHTMF